MAKEKFARAQEGDKIMRTGRRSQMAKLLAFIDGNPAFEGFTVDKSLSAVDLEAEMAAHLRAEKPQTITRAGAVIDARPEE